jgi:prevent-host-death family protein
MRGIAVTEFSIADAKTRFSELIQKAMSGEEVIIAKDNKPVVKVVPIVSHVKKRIPGSAKGQIWVAPDFEAALEDFTAAYDFAGENKTFASRMTGIR